MVNEFWRARSWNIQIKHWIFQAEQLTMQFHGIREQSSRYKEFQLFFIDAWSLLIDNRLWQTLQNWMENCLICVCTPVLFIKACLFLHIRVLITCVNLNMYLLCCRENPCFWVLLRYAQCIIITIIKNTSCRVSEQSVLNWLSKQRKQVWSMSLLVRTHYALI